MIRFTIAGLAAIISSASAIQTQADASAQWGNGGYNFNPWSYASASPSYNSGYNSYNSYYSNPFSYGDSSKVQRISKDVTYLVKMNSSLKTRMTSVEDAITALQSEHEDPTHIKDLEDRVTALEQKVASNTIEIDNNDADIEGLDDRVWVSESAKEVFFEIICDSMNRIATNSSKIAANMMSVAENTAAVATIGDLVSAEIASKIATINAAVAANSDKIAANMMSVVANQAKVDENTLGVSMISSDIVAKSSMVSEIDPVFIATLQNAVSTNSLNISNGGLGTVSAQIASNSAAIAANTSTEVANASAIAVNSANASANKIKIPVNCAAMGTFQNSFEIFNFQVSDNMVSNKRHDLEIASNKAAIAAKMSSS